jgi:tetratricopeptide (TPR) repeat protein
MKNMNGYILLCILLCTIIVLFSCTSTNTPASSSIPSTETSSTTDLVPENARNYYNLGVDSYNSGDYKMAVGFFDKATSIYPDYESAWFYQGNCYYLLKSYEEAVKCFDKVITINPSSGNAWYSKGLSLFLLKQYKEAIPCFDQTLAINPTDSNAWNNKGVCLECLSNYSEAMYCYSSALKYSPNLEIAKGNFKRLSDMGITLPDMGSSDMVSGTTTTDAVPETCPYDGNYWGTLTYKVVNNYSPDLADETITGSFKFSISLSNGRAESDGWHFEIAHFSCDESGWFPQGAIPAKEYSFMILPKIVGDRNSSSNQMNLYGAPYGLQIHFAGSKPGSFKAEQIAAFCNSVDMGGVGGFITLTSFSNGQDILTNKQFPFNDTTWGKTVMVTKITLSRVSD